jgi:hypothetical protein
LCSSSVAWCIRSHFLMWCRFARLVKFSSVRRS